MPHRSIAVLALVGVLSGCVARNMVQSIPLAPKDLGLGGYSEEDLRSELLEFASRFATLVATTAEEMAHQSQDREIQRRALRMRVLLVPMLQDVALQEQPRLAYVQVLALVVATQRYAVRSGATEFGDQQPLLVATTEDLADDILAIGSRFLKPDALERASSEVEAFADEHSVRSELDFVELRRSLSKIERGGRFGWLFALPMTPFRALEGAEGSTAMLRDLNNTAEAFARIAAGLPEQLRWQSELMLFSIGDRVAVEQSLAAVNSLVDSANRLVGVAEALPNDLQAVLGDVSGSLAEVDELLRTADRVSTSLLPAFEQLERAGNSWGELFGDEPDPDDEPFEIEDWAVAAREVSLAAENLSRTAAALQSLLEAPRGEEVEEIAALVEQTRTTAEGLVDYALWRAFLLGIALVLAVGLLRLIPARRAS